MKNLATIFRLLAVMAATLVTARAADNAAPPAAAPALAVATNSAPERSITERLEDLEAYVNNGTRKSDRSHVVL